MALRVVMAGLRAAHTGSDVWTCLAPFYSAHFGIAGADCLGTARVLGVGLRSIHLSACCDPNAVRLDPGTHGDRRC